MSELYETELDENSIQIINHENKYLLSIDYKHPDIKKLIAFFNQYPRFWYNFSNEQIYCDSSTIEDVQTNLTLIKSIFVI